MSMKDWAGSLIHMLTFTTNICPRMLKTLFAFWFVSLLIYVNWVSCFLVYFRYCGGAVLWLEPGKIHNSQLILGGQDQDWAGGLMGDDRALCRWCLLSVLNRIFQSAHFVHIAFWCQCLCPACVRKQSLIAISGLVVQWVSVWEVGLQLSA